LQILYSIAGKPKNCRKARRYLSFWEKNRVRYFLQKFISYLGFKGESLIYFIADFNENWELVLYSGARIRTKRN